jgi:hypothetical protein
MDANDVMKELSKNHTRPPVAALHAAVTLRSEVAPLILAELKRLLATFDANLDAPTEKEYMATMKQAVKAPSPLFYGFFLSAEWKQKEAFRPFSELLSRPEAMFRFCGPSPSSVRTSRPDSSPSSTTAIPLRCSSFSWVRTPAIPFASGNGEP